MPGIAGIRKFFGRTVSEGAAFAAGVAVAPALEPVVREVVNEAWTKYQTMPLAPADWAEIVSEDVESLPQGEAESKKHGVKPSDFDALVQAVLNAPGVPELLALWRRGLIDDAGFAHGLRKARLETRWDGALKGLHDVLLSSEELAMMQQQGFIEEARANSEGALQGVTNERQQLRYEASGLPPGVETALEMLRRSIIDDATFAQIVREGHTKTKYTDVLAQLRTRVLSAASYATLALKGWITQDEMHAGGALTGYSPEQMDLLFKEHGRPATTHQVFIGNIRGGRIGGSTDGIDPDFLQAVRQSDIRPEYAPPLWAARYTYPSAFVLRQLTQSGDITVADAEQVLKFEGWEPTFAAKVAQAWGKGTSAASKEASATDLLTLYDGEKATRADTLAALEALGYPADEAARKLDVIEARRVVGAKSAATSDLHAAYKKGTINAPATTTALQTLGLSAGAAADIVAAWHVLFDAEAASAPPTGGTTAPAA